MARQCHPHFKMFEKINTNEFWEKLEAQHSHVNKRYVVEIMRSLNEWGYLNKKGRKYLEKLIVEK